MGKYIAANPYQLVTLKHNPYQVAGLQAQAARFCPACAVQWVIRYGEAQSALCPKCRGIGQRAYNRLLFIAGRQGGKTRIGTLMGVLEATVPNSYGWITAPTYRDLTDFVEPAFFAQLPQTWLDRGEWSASDRILTLPNNAVVAFRSLEDPQTLRGPTLDWLLMDETAKIASRAWEVANPALAIKQGLAIFTTTPAGEDWVYEDLWLTAERGEPGWWAAKYKSIDNPIMSAEFIDSMRRQMSDEMFRQEYEADFVSFRGAIYGALVQPCVIESDEEIRKYLPEWPKLDPSRPAIVGLDPGSDHPFAGVLAVATPNALVLVGEYRKRELPAMTHAQNLHAMVGKLHPRWAIDRSQAQMIIELAQHGIYAQAAENKVTGDTGGIERVKTWMLSGQLKIIKARCPMLIKELTSYRWAETEKNDGSSGAQQPYKRNDDLADALRYLLMAWPHLPERAEIVSGRDLSTVPDKMRMEIERLARHDGTAKRESVADGMGEFYARVDEDESGTVLGMFEDAA